MDVDKTLNVTCETMKDIRNYSLLKHNTFGIDASCKRFLEYASVNEAKKLVLQLTDDDSPILIIGREAIFSCKVTIPERSFILPCVV